MSLNRYRLPGTLLLEVRTTTDRQPWLSALTRHQIAYCLGYATSQVGTVVHGAIVHGDTAVVLATDTTGLFSRFTQRFHTALTELANTAHNRNSGTIWDNKKPRESVVLGWAAAIFAFSLIAVRAAAAAGSSDPCDHPGYFGPQLWGSANKISQPDGFNKRSQRPQTVWLNPKAPDCAPADFGLEELIVDVDNQMQRSIAAAQGRTPHARPGRGTRGLGRRTCRRIPPLAALPNIIGEINAAEAFDAELRLWRAYYQRCRRRFHVDQRVVFPAGTDRFQALGAAVRPCPIYIAPPQPRRMHPPRPPPRGGDNLVGVS